MCNDTEIEKYANWLMEDLKYNEIEKTAPGH